MALADERIDDLAALAMFADLGRTELVEIAHDLDEELFPSGSRVLRKGISGYNFYIILEGEASVMLDGKERARLAKGDFFGEISVLLQDAPTADVVAGSALRCLYIPADRLRGFLLKHPQVMYRMLQAEAMRVKRSNEWQN